ncbi:hypothetical protein [Arthrobacter sp. RCC_34]|uniref:hypothetical protein n=1 Tax=Arthrobacter sp. RCC_34 TaxID=3239230 RepID=UPI0035269789
MTTKQELPTKPPFVIDLTKTTTVTRDDLGFIARTLGLDPYKVRAIRIDAERITVEHRIGARQIEVRVWDVTK